MEANLCDLGYMNYNKGHSYESYKNTSYLVKETNNHTISSNKSNVGHWAKVSLTVNDTNSNCCLKITDTENEETITRCIKSQLNPEDGQIELI